MRRHLLLFLGLISILPGQSRNTLPVKRPSGSAERTFDIDNAVTTRGSTASGATGSAVIRAQILLDRAGFSVGEIDGRMGSNSVRAVEGFRAARGLPAGDSLDEAAWMALHQDTAPVLVEYTVTAADVNGPFTTVPQDMMRKAKLKSLDFSSALEGLSEKFHASPAVMRQLNPRGRFTAAGEKIMAPNVRTQTAAKASRVVVSKSKSTVTVLDSNGKVLAQYPCTSGSEYDPLPIGEWQITGVFRNPKFNYNPKLFWDASPKDSSATIAAGPNNPVGVVWIDLSKEHYGIHGTPLPGQVGHAESHGCIRLTNWDAAELAGMVEKGIPVSLTE